MDKTYKQFCSAYFVGTVAVQQPAGMAQQPSPAVSDEPVGPAFTDEDVAAMKEMFPNIDEEVVRSVLEANRGDKDTSINNLLAMDSA